MKLKSLFALFALSLLPTAAFAQSTIYVHSGDNLQDKLESAQPGDTLILDAGAVFTGPFTLHAKGGSSYVTIQSSALASLPGPSQRVSPADAANMPRIVSPAGGAPALQTAPGASYYKFIGIEFAPADSNYDVDTLITLGDGNTSAQATLSEIPHDLIFDRCYIHAHPTQGVKRGVGLNSRETSILNSYVSDFKFVGADSQAVGGWNGPGPFHIINNYLEAAGENILFGGADANNSNNQPSDIEIKRNLISKPLSWRSADPYDWVVKNLIELKNAQRVTIEGNIIEHCWLDAQGGTAVLMTPRNQSGTNPWASVHDVVFRDNIIRHASSGIGTLSHDDEHPSQFLHDITVTNNLLYDIDGAVWSPGQGGGMFISFNSAGAYNLTVQHNTAYVKGTGFYFEYNTQVTGLVIKDNIAHAHYLFNGAAGTSALNGAAPNGGWVAQQNVLVTEGYDGSESYWQQFYPAQNYIRGTWASVGFVNYTAGSDETAINDFLLAASSPYKNQATDGTDIGADLTNTVLAAPSGFLATAQPTQSTSTVHLTWAAPAGSFDHYRIEYKLHRSDPQWTALSASLSNTATSYDHTTAAANTAYLYRICAVTGSQATCTAPDLATTTFLHDYPFQAGQTPIRAQHFLDLMSAVNAVRTLADLSNITWSPSNPAPAVGGMIYAGHLNSLRNGLSEALTTLGLGTPQYGAPVPIVSGTQVRASQLRELQDLIR